MTAIIDGSPSAWADRRMPWFRGWLEVLLTAATAGTQAPAARPTVAAAPVLVLDNAWSATPRLSRPIAARAIRHSAAVRFSPAVTASLRRVASTSTRATIAQGKDLHR